MKFDILKREQLYHELIDMARSTPDIEECITRAAVIVPDSLNNDERSVNCVLTTEDPVRVYDWRTGKIVLEVLVVAGCENEDQTPLLRDHNQYSVKAILGSVTDHAAKKDELLGLVTFGKELDEDAESIWRRVAQGHLRRVSVGYDYTVDDYRTIPAGETQTIAGRKWTAPKQYDLRVVTRWRLREVSVVVIPADARAQMRSASDSQRGTPPIDPKDLNPAIDSRQTQPPSNGPTLVNELLNFLRSHGLSAETTIADNAAAFAWARQHLAKDHYQALHDLCAKHSIEGFTAAEFVIPIRTAPTPPTNPAPGTNAPTAADGVRQERDRQTAIRNLAALNPRIPAAILQKSLDDGHTVEQASAAFRSAIEALASPPAPPVPTGAPAGHIRGGMSLAILQAGLLARCGIEPDHVALRSSAAQNVFRREELQSGWLEGASQTAGEQRNQVEEAFHAARRMRLPDGSLMRFCEAINALDGRMATYNDDEIMERAFSSGNFSAVFGSVVHLMMVVGYTETTPTYEQFCRVIDVADFREHKEGIVNGVGRLKKQGINGGEAALLNIEDPTISSVAAERYAGMLVVSDQTIINDTFSITDQLPNEVGISARHVPIELAFARLLSTANLSDSSPLFVNALNKIAAGTLDEDGLGEAGVLLKNQKIGDKPIVITESVLLHGTTLAQKAKKVITSETSSDGTINTAKGSYRRVEDSRVDLGTKDPANNDAEIAGRPGSYFLFAEPRRSLVVAFRRGTNRGPMTRTDRLPVGRSGQAWAVYVDCGAAATSRIGVVEVATS